MVGIYDCSLLYFADVDNILDVIHEINESRTEQKLLLIKGFDFFPRFEDGQPWNATGAAASYGLSWKPYKREKYTRGFFHIILKARAIGRRSFV